MLIDWDKLPGDAAVALDSQFAENELLIWASGSPWVCDFVPSRDPHWPTSSIGGILKIRRAQWTGVVWARTSVGWDMWPYDCPDCRVGNVLLLTSIRCPICGREELHKED